MCDPFCKDPAYFSLDNDRFAVDRGENIPTHWARRKAPELRRNHPLERKMIEYSARYFSSARMQRSDFKCIRNCMISYRAVSKKVILHQVE